MRWKTVIWFSVTLATTSAYNAPHLTIDDDLFDTPGVNEMRGPDHLTQPPTTERPLSKFNTAAITRNDVTTESMLTTEPLGTIKTTTEATTISNNKDKTTVESTTPEETDGNGITEQTTPISTTEPNENQPTQVGRSSEVVGEPGLPEAVENNEEYIIFTTNGPVQGYPWHTNPDIIGFIDIPYGAFQRYFQDPTPPNSWELVHQVRTHRKRCLQLQGNNFVGDLDCLTLSIFTPVNAVNASVLFYIHESNFVHGSGDPAIYGPDNLVSKGVILILPNYRLGPLGFLCLNNTIAPGNAALKDLTLALKWVTENIRAFGGDPTNVVVSGDGTSGALGGLLALSPLSNAYFSKAITESGSVLSHWALDRNPVATANTLLQKIREISISNITIEAADIRLIVRAARNIMFAPCIEHNNQSFLSNTPWSILHNSVVNITFMIGSANHAGAIEAANINEGLVEQMNRNFGWFLPSDLRFDNQMSRSNIGDKVRSQYFGNNTITLAHAKEMSLCFTDSYYLGPTLRTARALSQAGTKVYLYEFGFVGELKKESDSINRTVYGAVRGDIVRYLFRQNEVTVNASIAERERKMIDLLVNLWISFIDSGTPTSENINWIEMNSTSVAEESWLSIGDEVEMKTGLHVERLQLWTDIYAKHFVERNSAQKNVPTILAFMTFIIWMGLWISSPRT